MTRKTNKKNHKKSKGLGKKDGKIDDVINSPEELFSEFNEYQHKEVVECCEKFKLTNGLYSPTMAKRIIKIHKCVKAADS